MSCILENQWYNVVLSSAVIVRIFQVNEATSPSLRGEGLGFNYKYHNYFVQSGQNSFSINALSN